MRRVSYLGALCLALLVGSCLVNCSDEGEEKPNFAKMRVKQLRAFLSARGVSSAGIMEKADLVQLAEESSDLPIVEETPKPDTATVDETAAEDKPRMSDQELDDLIKKMSAETGAGFKVFRPGDDIESMMKNMGGPGGGKSKGKKKSKKEDL
eukprot:CAMPEP_0118933688 /NCGR_PEP_ID=MMETSP1169-20130426/12153_1 /TAXON_ID=36882 /ORGANISM="Pyramimonas obovata, Strain CCMP722" /LENGTH=151 /DNA_ID=CAMNT_0006876481 /DNA_START=95 /DNA_END=550 /DNA_ORIENTATION=+